MTSEKPIDPEAAAVVARVRKLMLIASVTTFVAVGAVLAVIGYRVFHWQGSAPGAGTPVSSGAGVVQVSELPAGAKVLSTAVGEGRLVLTLEIDGAIELRTFDLGTLKPVGRVRLAPAK
jgi:hypothetical protein